MVSQLYDPLGMAQPFLLPAKQLIQELRALGLSWDEIIPDDKSKVWNKWLSLLPSTENLSLDRCVRPKNFCIKTTQLHCFTDASSSGYGTVVYARFVDVGNNIYCSLS